MKIKIHQRQVIRNGDHCSKSGKQIPNKSSYSVVVHPTEIIPYEFKTPSS